MWSCLEEQDQYLLGADSRTCNSRSNSMACDGYVRILIVGEPGNEHYPKNLQSISSICAVCGAARFLFRKFIHMFVVETDQQHQVGVIRFSARSSNARQRERKLNVVTISCHQILFHLCGLEAQKRGADHIRIVAQTVVLHMSHSHIRLKSDYGSAVFLERLSSLGSKMPQTSLLLKTSEPSLSLLMIPSLSRCGSAKFAAWMRRSQPQGQRVHIYDLSTSMREPL